jgi:hypothetical protein
LFLTFSLSSAAMVMANRSYPAFRHAFRAPQKAGMSLMLPIGAYGTISLGQHCTNTHVWLGGQAGHSLPGENSVAPQLTRSALAGRCVRVRSGLIQRDGQLPRPVPKIWVRAWAAGPPALIPSPPPPLPLPRPPASVHRSYRSPRKQWCVADDVCALRAVLCGREGLCSQLPLQPPALAYWSTWTGLYTNPRDI